MNAKALKRWQIEHPFAALSSRKLEAYGDNGDVLMAPNRAERRRSPTLRGYILGKDGSVRELHSQRGHVR